MLSPVAIKNGVCPPSCCYSALLRIEALDFQRILTGTLFHQESHRRFVTEMSQDNMSDFNRDFTGAPEMVLLYYLQHMTNTRDDTVASLQATNGS